VSQTDLKRVCELITTRFLFAPIVGAELEFYGDKPVQSHVEIVSEDGENQWEARFRPQRDPLLLADTIESFKKHAPNADFRALPFLGQPGNAMHIHLHLEDKNGKNIFEKQGEEESLEMLYVINGLLESMKPSMSCFFPNKSCYQRIGADLHSPTIVSWGGNNRTTALRIPDKTPRRIEHRVPCSEANANDVLTCILEAALRGLELQKKPKLPKLYGNAGESQGPTLI